MLACWQTRATGWVKKNIDGSISRNRSRVTIGGVLRNPNGGCLVGFRMQIDITDILIIESKVVLEEMEFAWDRGFRRIEIECDNVVIIDGLRNGLAEAVSSIDEVQLIHELYIDEWQIKFGHISRDNNRVADQLVKSSGDRINSLKIFENPPTSIKNLLEEDIYVTTLEDRCRQ